MAVGAQTNAGNVNQTLTNLAIAWRELCDDTTEQWAFLNKLNTAGLIALGFSSGDAAQVLTMIDYLATPAQVFQGTVQAGGSGGTGAVEFNYEDATTPLWAGQ